LSKGQLKRITALNALSNRAPTVDPLAVRTALLAAPAAAEATALASRRGWPYSKAPQPSVSPSSPHRDRVLAMLDAIHERLEAQRRQTQEAKLARKAERRRLVAARQQAQPAPPSNNDGLPTEHTPAPAVAAVAAPIMPAPQPDKPMTLQDRR
jgi:hypothetical protein